MKGDNVDVRTNRFVSCRGVFQGGGCRGAAHAGAFSAAIESGVTFSAVAGTSAGSIIAALVGAGAKPDFVIKTLRDLDFRRFLGAPSFQDGYSTVGMRSLEKLMRVVPGRTSEVIADVLKYGGLHSSEPLERWLNNLFRELLPHVRHPLRFEDLLIPTSVVATDLARSTAKIWSSELTPDDSVAFAVRSSCALPFFFQSAVQGDSRYVDGGLLSNLPAFVHKDAEAFGREGLSDPVLAFRLEEPVQPPDHWDPTVLIKRLADAIVDGGIDLQLKLNRSAWN